MANQVEKDSVCAVFGLGAVGLAAVMGCQAAGASRIIAVDINSAKFEKARMFGATDCVNPRDHTEPIQEVVRKMTAGGVDYALECVGRPVVMVGFIALTKKKTKNVISHSYSCSKLADVPDVSAGVH